MNNNYLVNITWIGVIRHRLLIFQSICKTLCLLKSLQSDNRKKLDKYFLSIQNQCKQLLANAQLHNLTLILNVQRVQC